jgi:capsule polysaccharide modification protein KpsS
MQYPHHPHQMQNQHHLRQPQMIRPRRLMDMEKHWSYCRQQNLVLMSLLRHSLKFRYYQHHRPSRRMRQYLWIRRLIRRTRRQWRLPSTLWKI